jgi:hypothetical protein
LVLPENSTGDWDSGQTAMVMSLGEPDLVQRLDFCCFVVVVIIFCPVEEQYVFSA